MEKPVEENAEELEEEESQTIIGIKNVATKIANSGASGIS